MSASLPSAELLQRQAEWLAPIRARLLRRIGVAHRRRILDLGAGYGAVTAELVRRGAIGGLVVALDLERDALVDPRPFAGAGRVCANAVSPPFPTQTFDLVFCQCALLWMPARAAVEAIRRILMPGGALVALEPDYGGLIEAPPGVATRELWIAALQRAGADPFIGRALPGLLEACGFQVRVDLLPELLPPDPARFQLLRGLPLTDEEQARLAHAQAADSVARSWARVAHLPFFIITAIKS
jgi:SAM-dependent methyltransferase